MNNSLGVYIHIPFCVKKCAYCDFYSCVPAGGTEEYTDAVIAHMSRYKGYPVDTVYIGGGTPSTIPSRELCRIISTVRGIFALSSSAEISVECNPGTVSRDSLAALAYAGVNRVSFGAQSSDSAELEALGRIHRHGDTVRAVQYARAAGIDNINADLMYGIPNQTKSSFARSLSDILALGVNHVSAYALKIEENTPFYAKRNSLKLPDEDEVCDMLGLCCDTLLGAGLNRYEISNFAVKGAECRHNLKYWHGEEYLAFGPSASSYFGGKRYTYSRSTRDYIRFVRGELSENEVLTEVYEIDDAERERELVMLSLRLCEGLSRKKYLLLTGRELDSVYGDRLNRYITGGFMTDNGTNIALTPRGFLVSNEILCELLY